MTRRAVLVAAAAAASGCSMSGDKAMNALAERYVKVALAVGHHDPDYVDAYYGPAEWKAQKAGIPAIRTEAQAVLREVTALKPDGDLPVLRQRFLDRQLQSLLSRLDMLEGRKLSFDDESKALYDAVAPALPNSTFEPALAKLETLLPGKGPLAERHEKWLEQFQIPSDRIDRVFQAAIREARNQTREHVILPLGEDFRVEYETQKVWSAYNWYKGQFKSLIQVNVDLPIWIDRIVHLACHEGYPGHHIYNTLLEERLVNQRKWMEYTIYPLFSPQSLIAEGTADYGVSLLMPEDRRLRFTEGILLPAAGLDTGLAKQEQPIRLAKQQIKDAPIQAARRYLDGAADQAATVRWLMDYALMTRGLAERQVRFFEKNRSYVINYSHGENVVRDYLRKKNPRSGTAHWMEFEALLSTPRTPSGLA
jgi:hypothetical protein